MLGVKQGNIKYHFWVFCITWAGIEIYSPGPLANTQPINQSSVVLLARIFKTLSRHPSLLSSSCVNCPSLISSWLLIINNFWDMFFRNLWRFPRKFSKYCFHRSIRSPWLVVFSLAPEVLFLLFTSFTVCNALVDCLSSTDALILLIWFCMYFVCSFRYTLVSLFCAFLSFWALILVGFLQLHCEVVFTSARFFF